ncbi:MAG: hypothetical protein ACRC41_02825 [Sarcina sp.]
MHKNNEEILEFIKYMSGDKVLRRVFQYIMEDEETRIFEIKFCDTHDKGEIGFEKGKEMAFVKFNHMHAEVEYYDVVTKERHKCKSILDEVEELMHRPGYHYLRDGLIKVFYNEEQE